MVREKRLLGYIWVGLWLFYLYGNSAGILWVWGYGVPLLSGGCW